MRSLRAVHRMVTLLIVVFTLYLGFTGTLIQWVDLHSILTHRPATDPNVQAMREGFSGPGGYLVITSGDYTAAPLPASNGLKEMLETVLHASREKVGTAPLRFLELRVVNSRPVGQVQVSAGDLLRFDAISGAFLGHYPELRESQTPESLRNTVKHLHRMTSFGNWALWINVCVGTGLAVLIVTGLLMYWKLWRPRMGIGRRSVFWAGGGFWKTSHRAVSFLAAAFLAVIMLSGTWLAFESLWFGYHLRSAGGPGARDRPAPLLDVDAHGMFDVTWHAYQALAPGVPARVVRLRNYGSMEQGVIVSGEEEARQLVFNAQTGKRVTTTEPGYPLTAFPFGWEAHQVAKSIHRGDYFGLTGRWLDFFSGLALMYLSITGMTMYFALWRKRRSSGRSRLLWS